MLTSSIIEFLSIAFRYFFVFYIIYFLWQGITYIRIERGYLNKNLRVPIFKQKIIIIFMHIKAFFVLSSGTNVRVITYGLTFLCIFLLQGFIAKKIYKNSCPLIWNGFFFLTSIGSIMLTRLNFTLANRQLLWLFVSLCVVSIMPFVIKIFRKLERLEYVYLILGLGLLLSTFIFGTEEFGSLRFIEIGDFGFSPAEAVSFTYILYIATAFRKKREFYRIIFPSLMAVVHVIMLVLQRNLGGALIFFFSYMIIMYISTGRKLLFAVGIGFFAVGSVLSYHLFGHVQVRVAVWQNPWNDVHGFGFQTIQSLFAMGTWGAFGSGLGLGIPGTVPVVARDLTFAAVGEEMGWIFALGMIGVYLMIFYRGMHVALRCNRRYYSLLAVGFTFVLAFQTFLIIGGTINFIPLTGITMPFVSYGGSSLLISTLKIGMLQWISSYYATKKSKNIKYKLEEE